MAHLLMRTHLWALALAFCLSFFGQAFAADNPAAPTPPAGSPAAVKLKLLGQLETDGYLSHQLAAIAHFLQSNGVEVVAQGADSHNKEKLERPDEALLARLRESRVVLTEQQTAR